VVEVLNWGVTGSYRRAAEFHKDNASGRRRVEKNPLVVTWRVVAENRLDPLPLRRVRKPKVERQALLLIARPIIAGHVGADLQGLKVGNRTTRPDNWRPS
jgi:hypothetical protein